jgi:hypothetical protein
MAGSGLSCVSRIGARIPKIASAMLLSNIGMKGKVTVSDRSENFSLTPSRFGKRKCHYLYDEPEHPLLDFQSVLPLHLQEW